MTKTLVPSEVCFKIMLALYTTIEFTQISVTQIMLYIRTSRPHSTLQWHTVLLKADKF